MDNSAAKHVVVLIPSLEPDERLPEYIRRLRESGFGQVVVVDDGSGPDYQDIFREAESIDGTVVLHHEVNKGKGVALKTGYRYISDHLSSFDGILTADADGQHTVEDCLRLAEKLRSREKALYLGSRDFSLDTVPPKSKKGNQITSLVFRLLYGKYLPDTQTGLRAFRREELPFMIGVEGERYEYEMKVLIACSRSKIPMIPVTIQTIYENDNAGTHFHPVRDSWRIYRVILGSFFRFMASSLICVAIDQGLFNFLNLIVFANGEKKSGQIILLCTVIARIVSATANFLINRNLVFSKQGKAGKPFIRYTVLCIGIMLLSAGGTWLFSVIGLNSTLAKLITDFLLYFVSYRMQEWWVFRNDG